MCWVLDGLLRRACARLREYVREHVLVRAMSVCVCACAHLCVCSFACVRAVCMLCACARVLACTRAFLSACACDCAFPSDCNFLCVCTDRVCVRLAATYGGFCSARAALCGHARVAAVRCHRLGLARVGRRCQLDEPHGPGGMGCASLPHVGGRRRRRHLRHRRRRRQRTLLLQRRVREHRRRCAAGRSPGRLSAGTRVGTKGY